MFVCYPQRIIYSPADGAEECSRAALFRRERQFGQMKQTTITAVLAEIKFRNKRKTASTAHVITENGH
jgi:hypothetical protein